MGSLECHGAFFLFLFPNQKVDLALKKIWAHISYTNLLMHNLLLLTLRTLFVEIKALDISGWVGIHMMVGE